MPRMPTRSVIMAFACGTLLIGHLLVGGAFAGRTVVWLLTRHRTLRSDATRWIRQNVATADAIASINQDVPRDERVIVYSLDPELAKEVAFYCFPRPIEFRGTAPAPSPCGKAVCRLGTGEWAVWLTDPSNHEH